MQDPIVIGGSSGSLVVSLGSPVGERLEVRAMSSETWQEIWGLLALSLWIGIFVAIVCFKVLELRDDARAARRDERALSPRSEKPVERKPSTSP
jgi:hypothetical protein